MLRYFETCCVALGHFETCWVTLRHFKMYCIALRYFKLKNMLCCAEALQNVLNFAEAFRYVLRCAEALRNVLFRVAFVLRHFETCHSKLQSFRGPGRLSPYLSLIDASSFDASTLHRRPCSHTSGL